MDDGGHEGMPCFARIASASRSGSPGMSGPGVPGAASAAPEDADPFVNPALELITFDEPVDPHRPEEVADPLAHTPARDLVAERERRHERAPVRPAEDAAQDVDHRGKGVALVAAVLAVAAERLQSTAVDHPSRIQ